MARSVKCPRLGCHGIGVPVDTQKKFSFGKSAVGGAVGTFIAGPIGFAVGAATGIKGKNGKTTFVCNQCGKVFEKQL